jgi:hypothetical protein
MVRRDIADPRIELEEEDAIEEASGRVEKDMYYKALILRS